jgi:hypothetical protein
MTPHPRRRGRGRRIHVRHCTPVRLSRGGCSCQFGRASAPMIRDCSFDKGAVKELRELLRAVAAFAVGGKKTLAAQNNAGATKLLKQLTAAPPLGSLTTAEAPLSDAENLPGPRHMSPIAFNIKAR